MDDEEYPCPNCGALSEISEFDHDDWVFRMVCTANRNHVWWMDYDEDYH